MEMLAAMLAQKFPLHIGARTSSSIKITRVVAHDARTMGTKNMRSQSLLANELLATMLAFFKSLELVMLLEMKFKGLENQKLFATMLALEALQFGMSEPDVALFVEYTLEPECIG